MLLLLLCVFIFTYFQQTSSHVFLVLKSCCVFSSLIAHQQASSQVFLVLETCCVFSSLLAYQQTSSQLFLVLETSVACSHY